MFGLGSAFELDFGPWSTGWRLLLWLLASAVQFLDYLLLTASWNIYYYGRRLWPRSPLCSCPFPKGRCWWVRVLELELELLTDFRCSMGPRRFLGVTPSHIGKAVCAVEGGAGGGYCYQNWGVCLVSQLESQNAERMPMDQRVPGNNAALKVIVCQLLDSRDAASSKSSQKANQPAIGPKPKGVESKARGHVLRPFVLATSLRSFGPIIGSQLVSIYQIVSAWQSASPIAADNREECKII